MAVRLRASSLMEVIVSSVVMLIVFMLSMEIVTRLSAYQEDNRDQMRVLQTMKLLINTEVKESMVTYEWGEIEVVVEKLSEKLEKITLIATVKKKTWQLTKIRKL